MSDVTLMAEEQLKQLRAARAEVNRLKASIHAEMQEKAEQGQLWTNGRCRDWNAYEEAQRQLDELRAEIQT